jgi:hypothetical protein
MGRRTTTGLLAPALALLALAAVGQPAVAQTPAGARIARDALLRRHELGPRWSVASSAPVSVPALTCPRFKPPTDARLETGAAASPTFQAGPNGPFVSQTSYAFATGAERSRVWHAVVRPPLIACVAAGLLGGAGAGVDFKITAKRLLAPGRLEVAAAGFSVTGTATSNEVPTSVYLDAVVLGHGQTITEISVSGFAPGEVRSEALRLARIIARRIAGARSASVPPAPEALPCHLRLANLG